MASPFETSSFLSALRCSGGSDVGRRREENQDNFGVILGENYSLYLVADGMGGVEGGAIASRLAINKIKSALKNKNEITANALVQIITEINSIIHQHGRSDPRFEGMGTTLVGLLFIENHGAWIINVGDSRAYRIRDNKIDQITDDHTLVRELVKTGALHPEQAENHPVSHMLTRSLGPVEEVQVDCEQLEPIPSTGDIFILCSDGLYNMVTPEEIKTIVLSSSIDDAVPLLIKLANQRGGLDNITVSIVSVGESEREFLSKPEKIVFSEENLEQTDVKINRGLPILFKVVIVGIALFFGVLLGQFYTKDKVEREIAIDRPIKTIQTVPPKIENTSVPTPIIEQIEPSPQPIVIEPVDAELRENPDPMPTVSATDLAKIEKTREVFSEGIKKIDQQLAALEKPTNSEIGTTLSDAKGKAEIIQSEMSQIEARIDTASRKLSQWYGRQKKLENQDPIKLAAEVGASYEDVQNRKIAFEKATYEYIKKRDQFELSPEEKLGEEVNRLKDIRIEALRALQDAVIETVKRVLEETDAEINDLRFQRDLLNLKLQGVRQDLDFAKVLTGDDSKAKEEMKRRLEQKREGLVASLREL